MQALPIRFNSFRVSQNLCISSNRTRETVALNPVTHFKRAYPFGMDPIWQVSGNKIIYMNSFKMKLSVILGVGQMLFGIVLNFRNFRSVAARYPSNYSSSPDLSTLILFVRLAQRRHFNDQISILAEFFPQMVFLLCIFGYMDLLILIKWIDYDAKDANCAPSILILMINMFLMKYPNSPCSVRPMYSGQQFVQSLLLFGAFMAIPWMLFLKPFMLKKQRDYQ
jgi:V-type H+-transporting ATPase subunit a